MIFAANELFNTFLIRIYDLSNQAGSYYFTTTTGLEFDRISCIDSLYRLHYFNQSFCVEIYRHDLTLKKILKTKADNMG